MTAVPAKLGIAATAAASSGVELHRRTAECIRFFSWQCREGVAIPEQRVERVFNAIC